MEELQELNDHLSILEEKFEKQKVHQTTLQIQSDELQRTITLKSADNKMLQVKKHHQDLQIEELCKELERLKGTLNRRDHEESDLKIELSMAVKERSHYRENENIIKKKTIEAEKEIKLSKEEIRAINNKISEFELDISEDCQIIENLNTIYDKVMSELNNENEKNIILTEKCKEIEEKASGVKEREIKQSKELEYWKAQVAEKNVIIESLKAELYQQKELEKQLNQELRKLENNLRDLYSEEDSLRKLERESNLKINEIEHNLSREVPPDIGGVMLGINFIDNKISDLNKTAESKNIAKENLIKENFSIKKKIKISNDEIKRQKSQIDSLANALKELKKQNDSLEMYLKRKHTQRYQRQIAENELNIALDSFTSLI
ncbi:unnamed protein product [Blepharisma stoltei]|uniref:Uncharacterized protein n=1 Tax=Blepharisma stoltei TaxID=1481888 RepID=A0AAU9K2F7_9CILI|nr:unnamed protein product [Blepharisma stoltei]